MSSNITNEQPMSKRQKIDAADNSKKGAFSAILNGATDIKHHISGQNNQPPDILPITKNDNNGTTIINSLISDLSSSINATTEKTIASTITATEIESVRSQSQSPSDELDHAVACNALKGIRDAHCATEFPDLLKTSPDVASTSSSTSSSTTAHPIPSCSHKHITTTSITSTTNSNETSSRLSSKDSGSSSSCCFSRLNNVDEFQMYLMQQCLCDIEKQSLRRAFATYYYTDMNGSKYTAPLMEWPAHQLIQFLSNMELLFEVYLNQNAKGEICARIMQVCDALLLKKRDAEDECYEIIDEILQLAEYNNKIVQYLAIKVLANCLLIVKDKEPYCEMLLKTLMDNLVIPSEPTPFYDHLALGKISFILGIIQHIMEWKDNKEHPQDNQIVINGREVYNDNDNENFSIPLNVPPIESNYFAVHHSGSAGDENETERALAPTSPTETQHHLNSNEHHHSDDDADDSQQRTNSCHVKRFKDSESFDSNELKGSILDSLKCKWRNIVENMAKCVSLLRLNRNLNYIENTLVIFLTLWERIISVDTCIEYEKTLPFHRYFSRSTEYNPDTETFVEILIRGNLPIQIYKKILTLFSASLCYTTTLALQPDVPLHTNKLAEELFNSVQNRRIFSSLPTQDIEPKCNVSFIGHKHTTIVYAPSDRLARSVNGNNDDDGDGDGDGEDNHGDDLRPDSSLLNENFDKSIDVKLLQKLVLLILKAIAVTVRPFGSGDSSDSSMDSYSSTSSTAEMMEQDWTTVENATRNAIGKLQFFLCNKLNFLPESHLSKVIVHLFRNQKNYLLEAMLCMLGTTIALLPRQPPFVSTVNRHQQTHTSNNRPTECPTLIDMICPVYTILEFLEIIHYQMHLMLDFFFDESCFLLYFLRFLKYIRSDWTMFQNQCNKWQSLAISTRTNGRCDEHPYNRTMDVLISLRVKLERLIVLNQFPYDISPLLLAMRTCESLYDEGNTFGLW